MDDLITPAERATLHALAYRIGQAARPATTFTPDDNPRWVMDWVNQSMWGAVWARDAIAQTPDPDSLDVLNQVGRDLIEDDTAAAFLAGFNGQPMPALDA